MLTRVGFRLQVALTFIAITLVNWVYADSTKILVESVLDDHMGKSVVVDGRVAMVGVPGTGKNTGAIFVFVRDEIGWMEQARLAPKDLKPNHEFGNVIALKGDTLVVGMPRYSEVGNNYGAVCVYTRIGYRLVRQ